MSSLLQPEAQESLQLNGVTAWHFEQQQAELACHLETGLTAYCVLASTAMIAAAGELSDLQSFLLHGKQCNCSTHRSI